MKDPYTYEGTNVLRNKLDIRDADELDSAETDLSLIAMSGLYVTGYHDFSTQGVCQLHKLIFGDVYDWAGSFRNINISKRELLLAGRSVWYSNCDTIEEELDELWRSIHQIDWSVLEESAFLEQAVLWFSKLWRIHPFREGNTRTVISLMTFFFEEFGYTIDRNYLAENATIVRDALVFCCLDQASEPEHFCAILNRAIHAKTDAISGELPISTTNHYKAAPHEYTETYDSDIYYRPQAN